MNTTRISMFCILLSGCASIQQESVTLLSPLGERVEVSVEYARTPKEQQTGLMHRTELATGHGMIFVFPEEQPRSFWMKNTLIPLDIIYFNAEGVFVSSMSMQPCKEDPCSGYPSKGPAQYVLEVPLGFVEENGIHESWILDTSALQKNQKDD